MVANIKAFDTWDAIKIQGNPFNEPHVERGHLAGTKIALLVDRLLNRIGFITVRIGRTNKFSLPRAGRTEQQREHATYYAVYSSLENWQEKDMQFFPQKQTEAERLRTLLMPTKAKSVAEKKPVAKRTTHDVVEHPVDMVPFTHYPLTQKQMLEQAAYHSEMSLSEYISTVIRESNRSWAYQITDTVPM